MACLTSYAMSHGTHMLTYGHGHSDSSHLLTAVSRRSQTQTQTQTQTHPRFIEILNMGRVLRWCHKADSVHVLAYGHKHSQLCSYCSKLLRSTYVFQARLHGFWKLVFFMWHMLPLAAKEVPLCKFMASAATKCAPPTERVLLPSCGIDHMCSSWGRAGGHACKDHLLDFGLLRENALGADVPARQNAGAAAGDPHGHKCHMATSLIATWPCETKCRHNARLHVLEAMVQLCHARVRP